jgi:hypothetical protein
MGSWCGAATCGRGQVGCCNLQPAGAGTTAREREQQQGRAQLLQQAAGACQPKRRPGHRRGAIGSIAAHPIAAIPTRRAPTCSWVSGARSIDSARCTTAPNSRARPPAAAGVHHLAVPSDSDCTTAGGRRHVGSWLAQRLQAARSAAEVQRCCGVLHSAVQEAAAAAADPDASGLEEAAVLLAGGCGPGLV